jgi:hypothetical protein
MPRNVRNFWIELEVDGKKQKIATGPRSAGGGFDMSIKVRSEGQIAARDVRIVGFVTPDGLLEIRAYTEFEALTLARSRR